MEKFNPDWLHWPETQKLIAAFGAEPFRFVGGCVRDGILAIAVKDVDLATPLLPEAVMKLLAKSGIKTIPTGIDHGTVTAVVGKKHFEITTLRRDVATDGRRAVVAYTDNWREDAERRDFTVNALYADAQGEITDYFNGRADLHANYVRFIGDPNQRIAEDALRILRFFRFFAHYGVGVADKDALTACAANAAKIDNLSGERIQQEMFKLLVADDAADVIDMMQENKILKYVLPVSVNVTSLKKLSALSKTIIIYPVDPILALMALLRSVKGDKLPIIQSIAARWKLSKAHYLRLCDLCVRDCPIQGKNEEKLWKKHIRNFGKRLFIEEVLLSMAERFDEQTGLKAMALVQDWNIPEFPVTGDDLIHAGLKSGKDLGVLLENLEEYWEENNYTPSKEELLARAARKT